jgi:cytochrome c
MFVRILENAMSYVKTSLMLFCFLGGVSITRYALSAELSSDALKTLAVKQCSQCHTFGQGEGPGFGPNLFGIIGKKAGSAQGFKYSPGFLAVMSGKTWDPKLLDRWLTDTQALVPGTGMTYFQDDPATRKKLIQFFKLLQ